MVGAVREGWFGDGDEDDAVAVAVAARARVGRRMVGRRMVVGVDFLFFSGIWLYRE